MNFDLNVKKRCQCAIAQIAQIVHRQNTVSAQIEHRYSGSALIAQIAHK